MSNTVEENKPLIPDSERVQFEAVKADVMARHPPSPYEDLQGMAADFDHYLRESDTLILVSVSQTTDITKLIEAHCRTEGVSAFKAAHETARIWLEYLCYAQFEAHIVSETVFADDEQILVLEFITVGLRSAVYVTGKIVVDMIRA